MKHVCIGLIVGIALAGCDTNADEDRSVQAGEGQDREVRTAEETSAHPPLGRYVCRQYMATIGWIDLGESGYAVGDVQGEYTYDTSNGEIEWQSGAYAGWPARYEFSPAGEGHAHDEYFIRMTDEAGALKIDCFLTRD